MERALHWSSILLLAATAVACAHAAPAPASAAPSTPAAAPATARVEVQTGGIRMIPIETPRGKFNVWTKRVGSNPKVKLLLLHGGPGGTHEYFECLESFLPAEGIEFIYYDQLGSAYSDQPKDDSLWTIERFVDELEQVRQALGLDRENFFLLGHSWGGILAIEYALRYPQHLKGLVVAHMMSSIPAYNRYASEVLEKQMDPAVVKEIKALEAKGQTESPRYMELLLPNFYAQHLVRLDPWPEPVSRSMAHLNGSIYALMQGPSEFHASGRLETWDRSKDLVRIQVPTLVIGAENDTMDPRHMRWMSTQFPRGSHLHCPAGSHMSMWDDQQTWVRGLVRFLQANAG
jgi:proline iminopeptidase